MFLCVVNVCACVKSTVPGVCIALCVTDLSESSMRAACTCGLRSCRGTDSSLYNAERDMLLASCVMIPNNSMGAELMQTERTMHPRVKRV